jgi:4-aminobutyrate aminotransferase/(S)-3-amino-2-methylpropionate transaminase
MTEPLSTSNASLSARHARAVPRGVASATPIYASRAENAELWDADGRRYIDFAGGIAVLNVGHRHPRVVEAVTAQLDRYTHTAFQVAPYEPYIRLAERLNALAPITGEARTALFTTGAEATENAVKIARAATGRAGVVAFAGGFHGRTLLSSAMTGKVTPYKRGLGPFPADIFHIPYPSATSGVSVEEALRALSFLFYADIEPEAVAAFIIEPVLGEGGFHMAPPEFLGALAALRERHGMLIIADEVQSGIGRTGRMFGIEHSGVEPDLLAVAKSLAGGFPLSGVIGRAEIMDAIAPGGLGGTYGGSPIGCAAAHAVLDIFEAESLLERANALGDRLRAYIATFAGRTDLVPIANLRGPGAMVAFDIVGRDGRLDGAMAKQVCARARDEGLILLSCGQEGQAIRILVPLTAPDTLIDEGLAMLERALAGASAGTAAESNFADTAA